MYKTNAVYGEYKLAKVSKNLARYRSENNFGSKIIFRFVAKFGYFSKIIRVDYL